MHGEISERVGVLFASREIFRESPLAIVRKLGQAFVEHDAIFEGRVHPLPVKRHDGVGGIADERDLVPVKPGRATDGDERTGRILAKILEQRRHQRNGIGKFLVEKAADLVVTLGGGKAARAFEFPEERAGE